MRCTTFGTGVLLSCLVLAPIAANGEQGQARGQNRDARAERQQARFRGMDTNRDGVITRQEWRGNNRSFDRLDRNRDGVLSGSEVWTTEDTDWQGRGERDNAMAQAFRRADANGDGIVSRSEWKSDAGSFNRVDVNNDGVLTEREYLGEGWSAWDAPVDSTGDQRTDRERAVAERFQRADANRDGIVSRNEWDGAPATFNRLDVNRDGVLTEREFVGSQASDPQRDSRAYQAGYDRGLADGRQAGREDRELRNQWDLEGQRELEQAGAGYTSTMGSREDYQVGYRAGFRAGYRQGFGRN